MEPLVTQTLAAAVDAAPTSSVSGLAFRALRNRDESKPHSTQADPSFNAALMKGT